MNKKLRAIGFEFQAKRRIPIGHQEPDLRGQPKFRHSDRRDGVFGRPEVEESLRSPKFQDPASSLKVRKLKVRLSRVNLPASWFLIAGR